MYKQRVSKTLKEVVAESEKVDIDVSVDFTDDLNALVESEQLYPMSSKVKQKQSLNAIKSKLSEEIDRLEEKYNEELAEEVLNKSGSR